MQNIDYHCQFLGNRDQDTTRDAKQSSAQHIIKLFQCGGYLQMAAGLIRMLDEASWLFYGTLDHFCMLGTYVSFSEILLIDTGIHAK